jgi:hypothetical protein
MESLIRAKEAVIRDFTVSVADLQRQLEPLQNGWTHWKLLPDGTSIDVTSRYIEEFNSSIAEYERWIAILQQQVVGLKSADY